MPEWLALDLNKNWKNWQGTVLVDEIGKEDTVIARNSSYKAIVIKQNLNIGDKVNVKITGISSHYLVGKVIK